MEAFVLYALDPPEYAKISPENSCCETSLPFVK